MKSKSKMKRIILILVVLLLLVVTVTSAWAYQQLRTPVAHSKQGQYIEIPKGSSPPTIVNKLEAETPGRFAAEVRVHARREGRPCSR